MKPVWRLLSLLLLGILWLTAGLGCELAQAQQLDMDYLKHGAAPFKKRPKPVTQTPVNPSAVTAPAFSTGQPLTASVSKTLYLPPAMYGQWSVIGTLTETNAREFFSPIVRDIWVLQREGDQVVISNPANGASANISVDKVEGDQAIFHREGAVSKRRSYQEIATITVHGDNLTGQNLNKLLYEKNGQVSQQYFGLYRIEATRISGARVQFKPEATLEGPDLEIEEVRH